MNDNLKLDEVRLTLGGNEILKGVSFALGRGQVLALLGPSGSGKTTILRAVAGLETPDSGRIEIDAKPVFDGSQKHFVPAEKRGLGLVFQSYALWPHRTVSENVAFGLRLRDVAKADVERRVQTALDQLGLGKLGARYPHQLSGGQQQRVAIARALVYEPPILLLDEPLSNLDTKLREEARVWLRKLISELGISALVVTHDQIEAMAMADRILLLNEGRIEQAGTPTEMYAHPNTIFAAEFMGANNRLAGVASTAADGRANLNVGGTELIGTAQAGAVTGDAIGLIRVERVSVDRTAGPGCVEMDLVTRMYLGDRWEYLFEREGLSVRAYDAEPLGDGRHHVRFPADSLWVFPRR
jgi:iron(III) transport system ATP-binding protein